MRNFFSISFYIICHFEKHNKRAHSVHGLLERETNSRNRHKLHAVFLCVHRTSIATSQNSAALLICANPLSVCIHKQKTAALLFKYLQKICRCWTLCGPQFSLSSCILVGPASVEWFLIAISLVRHEQLVKKNFFVVFEFPTLSVDFTQSTVTAMLIGKLASNRLFSSNLGWMSRKVKTYRIPLQNVY